MQELLRLYEAVMDKKIDPRNFQEKILKSGIVIRYAEVKRGLAHKSPFLYQFEKAVRGKYWMMEVCFLLDDGIGILVK